MGRLGAMFVELSSKWILIAKCGRNIHGDVSRVTRVGYRGWRRILAKFAGCTDFLDFDGSSDRYLLQASQEEVRVLEGNQ